MQYIETNPETRNSTKKIEQRGNFNIEFINNHSRERTKGQRREKTSPFEERTKLGKRISYAGDMLCTAVGGIHLISSIHCLIIAAHVYKFIKDFHL